MESPPVELIYFNVQARGQPIRYMLEDLSESAGVRWHERTLFMNDVLPQFRNRLDQERSRGAFIPGDGALSKADREYIKLKRDPNTFGPFGSGLPALVHGSFKLGQTVAVSEYCAKLCGAIPKDPQAASTALMVVTLIKDEIIDKFLYTLRKSQPVAYWLGNKVTNPMKNMVVFYFERLDEMVKDRQFITGDTICWADYYLYFAVDILHTVFAHPNSGDDGKQVLKHLFGQRPHLRKHYKRMGARPGIVRSKKSSSYPPTIVAPPANERDNFAQVSAELRAELDRHAAGAAKL